MKLRSKKLSSPNFKLLPHTDTQKNANFSSNSQSKVPPTVAAVSISLLRSDSTHTSPVRAQFEDISDKNSTLDSSDTHISRNNDSFSPQQTLRGYPKPSDPLVGSASSLSSLVLENSNDFPVNMVNLNPSGSGHSTSENSMRKTPLTERLLPTDHSKIKRNSHNSIHSKPTHSDSVHSVIKKSTAKLRAKFSHTPSSHSTSQSPSPSSFLDIFHKIAVNPKTLAPLTQCP